MNGVTYLLTYSYLVKYMCTVYVNNETAVYALFTGFKAEDRTVVSATSLVVQVLW